MDVYLLHLVGINESTVKVVDKVTWDWINNPKRGLSVPEGVLMEDPEDYEPDYEKYTSSLDNDRALWSGSLKHPTLDYHLEFETISEAWKVLKELDWNMVDSLEGMIY